MNLGLFQGLVSQFQKVLLTWHSRCNSLHLNYCFISELFSNELYYKILLGFHSDHSILKLEIESGTTPKGKGFWKFNTFLLADKNIYIN